MRELGNDPIERLIVGIDVCTADEALPIMDTLSKNGVPYVKIGPVLMLRMGLPSLKRELDARKFKGWFLDGKFCNTDAILEATAAEANRHSPTMMNCMADVGPKALKRFADDCREKGTLSLAVTFLTTKGEQDCKDQHNGRIPEEQVVFYANKWVAPAGLDGIVCSAKEAPALRSAEYTGLLVTPGIVFEGDEQRDQVRIVTPAEAFSNGTDYAVMVSGILKDPGPRIRRFVDEVGPVLLAS
jgi:orotidine-5'-phosphate decarboxylase